MRYVKTLAIAAVVAAAAMALVATASATVITSPKGTTYTGKITIEQEGTINLHGAADIACEESKAEGTVETHGSSSTASGDVSTWILAKCNQHVTVEKYGEIILHSTGNGNAEVTVNGTEVKVEITALAINCTFRTENTPLGTLTGSANTGEGEGKATVHADSSMVPRTGGSIFCGSAGELTGTYVVTTPSTLYVD